MIEEKVFQLDWYGKYGIEKHKSNRSYEKYAVKTDGAPNHVVKNETVAFIGAWGKKMVDELSGIMTNPDKLMPVFRYIEKLILSNTGYGFEQTDGYIKHRGLSCEKINVLEIIKSEEVQKRDGVVNFDNVLKDIRNRHSQNDKIIFQQRKPWTIIISDNCPHCGNEDNPNSDEDISAKFRTRFAFAIIPKDAIRII